MTQFSHTAAVQKLSSQFVAGNSFLQVDMIKSLGSLENTHAQVGLVLRALLPLINSHSHIGAFTYTYIAWATYKPPGLPLGILISGRNVLLRTKISSATLIFAENLT